jgi:hypothetical protein
VRACACVCVCVHNEFNSCVTCYSEKVCLLILFCLRFTQTNFIKLAAACRCLFVQKIHTHRRLNFTTSFHKIPHSIFEVKNIKRDGSLFTIISYVENNINMPACRYVITASEIRDNSNTSS